VTLRPIASSDYAASSSVAQGQAGAGTPLASRCESENERIPFPFIIGVERSGTTLMRAMLTSHPDLDINGEAAGPTAATSPAGASHHGDAGG
jgi:Sulfotransferase family